MASEEGILSSSLVKRMMASLFDSKRTEVLERPASFIIRLKEEPEGTIFRIILLPPKGFTANKVSETNPHPEVRKAKVTIKGGVRPEKEGFNLLKNAVKFAYFTKREIPVEENKPYAKIDPENEFYRAETKSSKEKFFVVKENGEGFYHNLINLSDEWLLLVLEKELRLQKEMDVDSKIRALDKEKKEILTNLIKSIQEKGDQIFEKDEELVHKVVNLEAEEITPALIEALNIVETGNHEPCTVYATILKLGKKNPATVVKHLKEAVKKKEAPKYYLEELIQKLG